MLVTFWYLQALTRVFIPLQQWLYFDAVECLPGAPPAPEDRLPCGSRYDQQIALFGREFQEQLGSLQVPKAYLSTLEDLNPPILDGIFLILVYLLVRVVCETNG